MSAPGPRETLVAFGEAGRLVGTLTHPADGWAGPERPTMLLFNAGVIPRVGPHRLNVKLARRLAASGFATLRFDLSGLGDSRASTGTLDFERQAIADVRCAMDEVRARTGATRFVTFGICSGAVLGYAAALEDPRIVGCAMLDPYMYPTWRTHATRMRIVVRQSGLLRTASGWLSRHLTPRGRAAAATSAAADAGVDLGLRRPPARAFAAGLDRLLARDARVLLIYTGSALYSYNYARQFDDVFARFGLAGRVRSEFLPHIDHTVTLLSAQRELLERLHDWACDHGR